MESTTAITASLGFLCVLLLVFSYRFLSRSCRRKVSLATVSRGGAQPGNEAARNTSVEAATATPQLCSYKKRCFLASIPSLDRFLCSTHGWQEGVTLESGLTNLSSRNQSREDTAQEDSARSDGKNPNNINNNGQEVHNEQEKCKEEAAPKDHAQPSGAAPAATQASGARVSSCAGNLGILANSILNAVSSIPNISLGFSQTQSLPNVHGCLAESVSTPTGSRDLVLLWSTTIESTNSGVLTSTRLE